MKFLDLSMVVDMLDVIKDNLYNYIDIYTSN